MNIARGAIVGAALLGGYLAGRRHPGRAAPAPVGALDPPAAELDDPTALRHAWLEWDDLDPRLYRSLAMLRIAQENGNVVLEAKVRRGLASLGYRA